MKHRKGFLQLFLTFGFALLLGGCGGSKSNSDVAPVAIAPPDSPVVATLSVTTDSHSASTLPSSVVTESNVAVTTWASDFFTVSGTCTTLPTLSLTLDATAKIITATLSGGTCSAGQSLILTIDPKAITFASAVSDSGPVWTRTYTIPALAQVTVGGTISGLTGTLVLRNNGGDEQTISTDGHFVFPPLVSIGGAYAVTVQTQPLGQTCSVSDGSGIAGAVDIGNVAIVCSANAYSVGGTVSGLAGSVVLQNNNGDTQAINSDGAFTFAAPIAHGGAYSVTVLTQPAGQTCTLGDGAGIMGAANVASVTVVCSANIYTVGGTVSGLSGTVVLQNNNADNSSITSNGSFTFATPVAEGSTYNVTVLTQPASQTCTVINGSGTMGGSNVTNIGLTCTTDTTTLSASSTGTIPINGGSCSLTITNTGTDAAYNVSAVLPGGWTGVTQDATDCTAIAPNGGTCTLSFTSTTPYVAQGDITVTGDNISSPPVTALAFSVDGYLVFDIAGSDAVVIDSSDLASNIWGANGVTNASSLLDGVANTATIYSTPSIGSSAAVDCYNSTSGGVSVGTWYLPAICQMGGAGQGAGCAAGIANIDENLVQLGFGGIPNGGYWSSTEYQSIPTTYAMTQIFGSSNLQGFIPKSATLNVRCARSIAY